VTEKDTPKPRRLPLLVTALFGLALLIFIGGSISFRKHQTPISETTPSTANQETQPEETKSTESSPKLVIEAFCESFFLAAAPGGNPNGPEAQTARAFLTTTAKKEVDSAYPNSISDGLTRWAGVQVIPDKGFKVGRVELNGDRAVVETVWNYSDGAISKIFSLIRTDNHWKIAAIE